MGADPLAALDMIFDVSHRTTYSYRSPVARSHHLLHLAPQSGEHQHVIRHSLLIEPAPAARKDFKDYFGNQASILTINEEHPELVIHARSTVEVHAPPRITIAQSSPWELVREKAVKHDGTLDIAVLEYTCPSRHTPILREALDFARTCFPPNKPALEAAWDLTLRIKGAFLFDGTATDISTPISQVLRQRRGVCQDFAHLALSCLRGFGLPARYVSGYLLTRPPPGRERLRGADASHAWVSVWTPENGWVDFDPTNGLMPAEEHISMAYGRDYDDVSPISGVLLGGSDQSMAVAVDVVAVT